MTSLTDLFEFLSSPNPSARHLALQNLVGHTPKSSPQRHIFIPSALAPVTLGSDDSAAATGSRGSGLGGGSSRSINVEDRRKIQGLRDMMGLCRDQAQIAHDALSALINLSDNLSVARHITADEEYLVWLVSYTANPTSPLSPLSSMLLSNLSSHPSLLPSLAILRIPLVRLPKSTTYPPYFLPASASASSTRHPDFRDPAFGQPDSGVGQEEETTIEGLRALMQAFEDGAAEGVGKGEGKRKGECHFLASVFANVSTLPSTRTLLLTPYPPFPLPSTPCPSNPSESSLSASTTPPTPSNTSTSISPAPDPEPEPLLSKLTPYTSHPDTIRRGGCLGAIKNIALDRGCHAFLLAAEGDRVRLTATGAVAASSSSESRAGDGGSGVGNGEEKGELVRGVDVLPSVLGPLMGGEEYDIDEMEQLPATLQFLPPEKQSEQDPVLRMMCVEILLLLSTTFTGRETLRKRGTYFVIRELHKVEIEQNIKDAIERLVSLLQGDEGRETQEDLVNELVRDHKMPAMGTGTAGVGVVSAEARVEELDDEDDLGGDMDVIEV